MIKYLMIFNCSFLLLLFGGCSQIQYVTGVDLLNSSNGWQNNANDSRTGKLIYKDTTISFSFFLFSYPPVEGYDQRIMAFGPPIIPIVPNLFAILGILQSNYVRVDIEIMSNPDSNSFKLYDAQLLLDDGQIVLPSKKERRYFGSKPDELVKNGSATLYFDFPRENVEKFQVVFGKYFANNRFTIIPTLNYKRWWNYHYVPWVRIPWDH